MEVTVERKTQREENCIGSVRGCDEKLRCIGDDRYVLEYVIDV